MNIVVLSGNINRPNCSVNTVCSLCLIIHKKEFVVDMVLTDK